MIQRLNRRHFIGSLLAGTVLSSVGAPVMAALSPAKAEKLVSKLVGEINSVISSGKSEAAMIKDFEKVFARYADVPTIARYALGADGRSASAGQIKRFTKAFQGYIARKYGKRFREFIGGRIEVQNAKTVKSFIEVKTTAFLKGEAPFEITFLVSDRSGKDLFFNMFIEGINMLLTERTEIGAMLDKRRGDLDAMIGDLAKAG